MSLQSDLTIAQAKFADGAIPQESRELNDMLVETMEGIPRWYEVGAKRYREMRWNNETALPRPPTIETGKNSIVPSRDSGRDIPIRVFLPEDGKVNGTFYHIHGGGWVLQSEHYQDALLNFYAQKGGLAVVSVGYRLAPEDPFPKGPEDCFDVADWLVENAEKEYGAPLRFMGGESAGAHLSVITLLHLHAKHPKFVWPSNGGLCLHFGCYDLSNFTPSANHFHRQLILDYPIMKAFAEAALPKTTVEERAKPMNSPLYADWKTIAKEMRDRGGKGLPRALFTCGTEDPLVDDSVFMAAKWQMCGGEGVLKIYPGAPHGFIAFPAKSMAAAREGLADTEAFVKGCLNNA